MKKILSILLILLLSVSLVSAGLLSDIYGKITGKTIGEIEYNQLSCVDSDGIARFIPGYVNHGDREYKDACIKYNFGTTSIDFIKEYFCEDNKLKEVILQCPLHTQCITDSMDRGFCKAICIDKDHKDRFSHGSTTGYSDSSYSEFITKTDKCVSENMLLKTYCAEDSRIATTQLKCPEGTYCNSDTNRCENREIIKVCEESDEGFDLYNMGIAKQNERLWQDYCAIPSKGKISSNEQDFFLVESCEAGDDCFVRESFCQNTINGPGTLNIEFAKCPGGCKNGECIKKEITDQEFCVDSDGGKIYSIQGKVKTDYGNFEDKCTSDSMLIEYFCEDNVHQMERVVCENGCKEGACLIKEEEKICETSDGFDIYIKGQTKAPDGAKYVDQCIGDYQLVEYFCQNNEIQKKEIECDIHCEQGACIKGCFDSDAKDSYVGGFVKTDTEEYADYCNDDETVIEFFCDGDKIKKEAIKCEYGCKSGKCVNKDLGEVCVDTDGGINIYETGKISEGKKTFVDFCIDDKNLFEFDCGREYVEESTHNGLGGSKISCRYGCEDGACNWPPLTDEIKEEEICKETDDGIDYFNKGLIKMRDKIFQDYCENSITLYEFTCDDGISGLSYNCEYGCSDGKCREPYAVRELSLEGLNRILKQISKRFVTVETRLDNLERNLGLLEKEKAIPDNFEEFIEDESYCGDGVCQDEEDKDSCPEDCGPKYEFKKESYCGDGVCDSDENQESCPEDCGPTQDYIRQKIKEWIQSLS